MLLCLVLRLFSWPFDNQKVKTQSYSLSAAIKCEDIYCRRRVFFRLLKVHNYKKNHCFILLKLIKIDKIALITKKNIKFFKNNLFSWIVKVFILLCRTSPSMLKPKNALCDNFYNFFKLWFKNAWYGNKYRCFFDSDLYKYIYILTV